jgi:hypothetical protein
MPKKKTEKESGNRRRRKEPKRINEEQGCENIEVS